MSNITDIIKQYNSILKKEIASAKTVIEESSNAAKLYGDLVLKHEDAYKRNRITAYMAKVLVIDESEFEYSKAYRLFAKDNIKNYMTGTIQDDESRTVRAYFYHFKEAALLWAKTEKELTELKQQEINDKTIKLIHRQFNYNMAVEMLSNGTHYPIGGGFRLRVGYKNRANRIMVGKKRQKVDWGASFKLLLKLLEELEPNLLEQYEDKIINKADLIDRAKPLFYNAKDNPKGKKWLVYDDKDFDFWLLVKTYDSDSPNKSFYGVTPVNYVWNATRSQADYLKTVEKVEDIITTKDLGFRDKIFMLEKFSLTHCLNTFTDDI